MSKTKEIECMVNPEIIHDKRIENYWLARVGATDKPRLKAKLIIEIPEQKIEITEEQIAYIVNDVFCSDSGTKAVLKQLGFTNE